MNFKEKLLCSIPEICENDYFFEMYINIFKFLECYLL